MQSGEVSRTARRWKRSPAKWFVRGVVAWLVVTATMQKGLSGTLEISITLIVLACLFALRFPVMRWFRRYAAFITVPAVFGIWLWVGGSYSPARDLAGFAFATAVCFYFVSGNFKRADRRDSRVRFQVAWCVLTWVTISVADRIGEGGMLPRRGAVVVPAGMPEPWKELRVGLALSGGGYRAALVHAGVIFELSQLGVPVTHTSTVSGGSILGSFIAAGGDPEDFVQAVAEGRFRIKRDITWIWNALRLAASFEVPVLGFELSPFGSASRVDIQAELLDRVLLGGIEIRGASDLPGPELIVNATDLRHGLSAGFTKDSLLLAGPLVNNYVKQRHVPGIDSGLLPVFFRAGQAQEFDPLPRLSRRAAVSGAFPGAFEATDVTLALYRQHRGFSREPFALELSLVDGGIRDNLGVSALQLADRLARVQADTGTVAVQSWVNDRIDPSWKLDLLIVSNGGQAFRAAETSSSFKSLLRAIELNGLETGALRPMRSCDDPPLIMLSDNATLAFTPDFILTGRAANELVYNPAMFIGPTRIDDESLSAMARMASNESAADELIAQLHESYDQYETDCIDRTTPSYACVREELVDLVGHDLWEVYSVFRDTPTLEDVFTDEDAHAIYRYGRYLVRIRAKDIREALNNAHRESVR